METNPPLGRNDIAERIVQMADAELNGDRLTTLVRSSQPATTAHIKRAFGTLGIDLGYKVAAHGFPDSHFGEWLYDIAWFVLGDAEIMIRQPVVIESEWAPGGSVKSASEVDGDFQKLVQARADVRVWLALLPNTEIMKIHVENCKRQARMFAGSTSDDLYVFILYNWTTRLTSIEKFTVGDLEAR